MAKTHFSLHLLSRQWWWETWLWGSPAPLDFLPACVCSVRWHQTLASLKWLTRSLTAVRRRQLKEQENFLTMFMDEAKWVLKYYQGKNEQNIYSTEFRVRSQDLVSFRFCRLSSDMLNAGLTKSTVIQTDPFFCWEPAPCHPDSFLFHGMKNPIGFRRRYFRSRTEA